MNWEMVGGVFAMVVYCAVNIWLFWVVVWQAIEAEKRLAQEVIGDAVDENVNGERDSAVLSGEQKVAEVLDR
jgi:hypothetical protein